MNNTLEVAISPSTTIEEALKILNISPVKILLIVDQKQHLIGTLVDGDIRRALLNKKSLDDEVRGIYSKKPIVANENDSEETLLNLCNTNNISQIPIIGNDKKVVKLFIMDDDFSKKSYENSVVLMGGGLGSRLRPLTENIPKPMLKVGSKPILQTIVEGFVSQGFTNITMCLGYKSNVIKDFFQDGSKFGANIDYVDEDQQMGTAGALTLLRKIFEKPFFVMNGDILTNINYLNLLNFHNQNKAQATMCVREYDMQVPYGVVYTHDENITSIEEKPLHRFFVNSGIYVLQPKCIDLIPKNEFYDMPSLFEKLINQKQKTISFPIKDYWLDIGQIEEYKKANQDIHSIFNI